jgi:peptide/nickel transport system permease protein
MGGFYSRVIYGARISLLVGLVVAITSFLGLVIGLISGFVRRLDKSSCRS